MPFLNLSLYNYRNLLNESINLLANEVFFVGENGQGKSNLLEAVYMSSYASSFRTHTDSEIVKTGNRDFSVRGFFKDETGKTDMVHVELKSGKKNILKNGKPIKDRKELINTIPCVLFCHDDMEFVNGEPERRRFFIDQSLSMYDVMYLDLLRKYKKILKSRNTVLKEMQYDLVDMYNQPLAETGLEIIRRRKNAVYQFNRIFSELYKDITGIENVQIVYDPSWKTDSVSDILQSFINRFEAEKSLGITLSGPHRDRIKFMRGEQPFIPHASTGQRRLVALMLRVAQAKYFKEITGKKPVLLMDDVLLELDPDKRQKFTSLLPEYDQLFCTFLPGEPYERYKKENTLVYRISEGAWELEK
ncbi:MAG: DNA replication and repair protein RecF [Treponemataceae bacterium]|nr:DNA replication and repair protein RecF [Treponemataceae bacterium]